MGLNLATYVFIEFCGCCYSKKIGWFVTLILVFVSIQIGCFIYELEYDDSYMYMHVVDRYIMNLNIRTDRSSSKTPFQIHL